MRRRTVCMRVRRRQTEFRKNTKRIENRWFQIASIARAQYYYYYVPRWKPGRPE